MFGRSLMFALLAAGLCFVASDAGACGNGQFERMEKRVRAIANAERQVESGKLVMAGTSVVNTFPSIKKARIRGNGMRDRAMRVMARVVVRTDGTFDGGPAFPGKTDAERKANMAWALSVLQAFSLKNKKDAEAKTNYGEALAALPKRRGDALKTLGWLEEKDLMTSAYGYAALMKLRRDVGEDKPAFIRHPLRALSAARLEIAANRCRKMTKDSALCGDEPKS